MSARSCKRGSPVKSGATRSPMCCRGDVSPSGKLPTTIPYRLEDTPAFTNYPGERGQVRYGEGVFVGYRWYDTRGIAPRFCVRPRLVVHVVRDRRADVGRDNAACAGHEHRHGARRRSRAVLRARRRGDRRPATAGAEGVRQGVARSRRVAHRSRSRSTIARSRSGTSRRTTGRSSPVSSSCGSARRHATSATALWCRNDHHADRRARQLRNTFRRVSGSASSISVAPPRTRASIASSSSTTS